jgi:hypothetical protein
MATSLINYGPVSDLIILVTINILTKMTML